MKWSHCLDYLRVNEDNFSAVVAASRHLGSDCSTVEKLEES